MQIRQLFTKERAPTRPLNEVVNAEEAIDLRSEVDEYVFTAHTLGYLRELIDALLDTAQGKQPDALRTWISGFFGSGKSHFLKLAAALLSNQEIAGHEGASVHALEYAVKSRGLALPWERIAKDFRIRAAVVNLAIALGGDKQAQERPLLYRLVSELCRLQDDSPVPHVAVVEREIVKAKKWAAFLDAVLADSEQCGDVDDDGSPRAWASIRRKAFDAHTTLEKVLPKVMPRFTDAAAVQSWLGKLEAIAPSPEQVVEEALRLALALDPTYGRVLLCVDEVALYLQGNPDRVREVQGLAETVKNKGKGRVFLWATAQQRVDTVDTHYAGLDSKVVFLQDRFPARFTLEERDIDEVVRERWLHKDDTSPAYATLTGLVKEHGGLLAHAAKLHDENLLKDVAALLTSETAVLAYYPCLPHHVRLLQAILTALRGEKQVDQTAAQSRALLTSIRALFLKQNGAALAEQDVGTLVTFDRVYDVIRDVVRKVDSPTDLWITETIEKTLGSVGDIKVSAVAKVILLLQQLNPASGRKIRVDAENVAALLYPRLGAPWAPHMKNVREACEKLLAEHFIGEEPDRGYRFYRQEEVDFQKTVDKQLVAAGTLLTTLGEAIEAQAKKFGFASYAVHAWHRLPVEVKVHVGGLHLPNPNATPKQLELHLIWPATNPAPNQSKLWAAQYAGADHVCLWHLSGISNAETLVRRSLKLQAAIKAHQDQLGPKAADFLRPELEKLANLQDHEIPTAIEAAILGGVIIHRGVDVAVAGQSKGPAELFRETLKQAVDHVFDRLEYGAVQVDEAGLKRVFAWQVGQPLPKFMQDLKLFDASGKLLSDRPFLKEVLTVLKGQTEAERTGSALLDRFGAIPYGWPERAIRAGLAALLRARWAEVRLADGSTLHKPTDAKAENWLIGSQLFNKAVLRPTDLLLTGDEIKALTKVFADVFEAPGADTVEKLDKLAETVIPAYLSRAQVAHSDLHGRQLPGHADLKALVNVLAATREMELPVGMLKTLLQKASGLAVPGTSGAAATSVVVPPTPPGTREAAVLRPLADLMRAVEKVRNQGLLDRLQDVRARSLEVYPPWVKQGFGAVVRDEVSALGALAANTTLIMDAATAFSNDQRCFDVYAGDYQTRHTQRHQHAGQALARLEGHVAWPGLAEDKRAALAATLTSLDCGAAHDLTVATVPTGCCPDCGEDFETLATQLELLDARESAALKKLDVRLAPPPKPLPPIGGGADREKVFEVRSSGDLAAVQTHLASLVEGHPGQVVTVTVHIEPSGG